MGFLLLSFKNLYFKGIFKLIQLTNSLPLTQKIIQRHSKRFHYLTNNTNILSSFLKKVDLIVFDQSIIYKDYDQNKNEKMGYEIKHSPKLMIQNLPYVPVFSYCDNHSLTNIIIQIAELYSKKHIHKNELDLIINSIIIEHYSKLNTDNFLLLLDLSTTSKNFIAVAILKNNEFFKNQSFIIKNYFNH